jgi:phosphatidylglycerophosphatase A
MIFQKTLLSAATFFGLGKVSKAPGTVATAATIPIVILMAQFEFYIYMVLALVIAILAIISAELYEQQSKEHDQSEIVIDEVAGFIVTMTWLPINWKTVLAGFLVFRFLDILKPFPISYMDKKIQGGIGVVADDLAAGIIGNILLQLILVKTTFFL